MAPTKDPFRKYDTAKKYSSNLHLVYFSPEHFEWHLHI